MCLILYGSATGNAADLADVLYDQLRRRSLTDAVCKPFGESSVEEMQKHRHVFVICSTTGQGALPPQTQPFWSQQSSKRSLVAPALSSVRSYSFGLGSSAYPKFNWATRKIHARLVQLGAQPAVARGEGDELGSEPYEAVFDQWMAMASSELDSESQIIDFKPVTELLPPINHVEIVQTGQNNSSSVEKIEHLKLDHALTANATVIENKRITSEEHFQDVRHLVIKLDAESPYEAGDVLRLYPANDEPTVQAIIESQGWSPDTKVRAQTEVLSSYESLLRRVDSNAIPRRKFFSLCAHFCSKEAQEERMREFSSDLDDSFSYTSRPRRSVAEVVLEFDSSRIPIEYILDVFPPSRSRQFSIASPPTDPSRIELCVAIVKYRTVLRRIRRGSCTRWIERSASPNARIHVSSESNKMQLSKKAAHRPVILVATGTGIAPIRSWMKNADPSTPTWSFFGCRNERDFSYHNEFGSIKVIPAFSQPLTGDATKTYVQAAIKQHAAELPVAEALIFVCGSSGPMPKAVREAFVECLQARGHPDGEQIMSTKEKAGLYFQETW